MAGVVAGRSSQVLLHFITCLLAGWSSHLVVPRDTARDGLLTSWMDWVLAACITVFIINFLGDRPFPSLSRSVASPRENNPFYWCYNLIKELLLYTGVLPAWYALVYPTARTPKDRCITLCSCGYILALWVGGFVLGAGYNRTAHQALLGLLSALQSDASAGVPSTAALQPCARSWCTVRFLLLVLGAAVVGKMGSYFSSMRMSSYGMYKSLPLTHCANSSAHSKHTSSDPRDGLMDPGHLEEGDMMWSRWLPAVHERCLGGEACPQTPSLPHRPDCLGCMLLVHAKRLPAPPGSALGKGPTFTVRGVDVCDGLPHHQQCPYAIRQRCTVSVADGRVASITQDSTDVAASQAASPSEGETVSPRLLLAPGLFDIHTHYDAELLAGGGCCDEKRHCVTDANAPPTTPDNTAQQHSAGKTAGQRPDRQAADQHHRHTAAISGGGLHQSLVHGVTSVIVGNCSIGASLGSANLVVDLMCRVESLPEALLNAWLPAHADITGSHWLRRVKGGPLNTAAPIVPQRSSAPRVPQGSPTGAAGSHPAPVPRDGEHIPTPSAAGQHPVGCDVAAFLPHSNLRADVIGLEAALSEDSTTTPHVSLQDIMRMCALLDVHLDEGYLGLSVDFLPFHRMHHKPHQGWAIPSIHADLLELACLCDVVRRKGKTVQVTPNPGSTFSFVVLAFIASGMFTPACAILRACRRYAWLVDSRVIRVVVLACSAICSILLWFPHSIIFAAFMLLTSLGRALTGTGGASRDSVLVTLLHSAASMLGLVVLSPLRALLGVILALPWMYLCVVWSIRQALRKWLWLRVGNVIAPYLTPALRGQWLSAMRPKGLWGGVLTPLNLLDRVYQWCAGATPHSGLRISVVAVLDLVCDRRAERLCCLLSCITNRWLVSSAGAAEGSGLCWQTLPAPFYVYGQGVNTLLFEDCSSGRQLLNHRDDVPTQQRLLLRPGGPSPAPAMVGKHSGSQHGSEKDAAAGIRQHANSGASGNDRTNDGGTSDDRTNDGGTSDDRTSDSGTSDDRTNDGGTSDDRTSDSGASDDSKTGGGGGQHQDTLTGSLRMGFASDWLRPARGLFHRNLRRVFLALTDDCPHTDCPEGLRDFAGSSVQDILLLYAHYAWALCRMDVTDSNSAGVSTDPSKDSNISRPSQNTGPHTHEPTSESKRGSADRSSPQSRTNTARTCLAAVRSAYRQYRRAPSMNSVLVYARAHLQLCALAGATIDGARNMAAGGDVEMTSGPHTTLPTDTLSDTLSDTPTDKLMDTSAHTNPHLLIEPPSMCGRGTRWLREFAWRLRARPDSLRCALRDDGHTYWFDSHSYAQAEFEPGDALGDVMDALRALGGDVSLHGVLSEVPLSMPHIPPASPTSPTQAVPSAAAHLASSTGGSATLVPWHVRPVARWREGALSANQLLCELWMDMLAEFGDQVSWCTVVSNDRPHIRDKLVRHPHTLVGFADSGAHNTNMSFYNVPLAAVARTAAVAPAQLARCIRGVTADPHCFFGLDEQGAGSIRIGAPANLLLLDIPALAQSYSLATPAPSRSPCACGNPGLVGAFHECFSGASRLLGNDGRRRREASLGLADSPNSVFRLVNRVSDGVRQVWVRGNCVFAGGLLTERVGRDRMGQWMQCVYE